MLHTVLICGSTLFLMFMVLLSIPQSTLPGFLLQLIRRGTEE
jgi:hypothetical protein